MEKVIARLEKIQRKDESNVVMMFKTKYIEPEFMEQVTEFIDVGITMRAVSLLFGLDKQKAQIISRDLSELKETRDFINRHRERISDYWIRLILTNELKREYELSGTFYSVRKEEDGYHIGFELDQISGIDETGYVRISNTLFRKLTGMNKKQIMYVQNSLEKKEIRLDLIKRIISNLPKKFFMQKIKKEF